MFVINDDRLLILLPNYAKPLHEHDLDKLLSLQKLVHEAVMQGKLIHFIEDDDIPFGKLFYIRGKFPHPSAPGFHAAGQPDHQKEQSPYLPQQGNGTAGGGQKFKIEIRGGDGPY